MKNMALVIIMIITATYGCAATNATQKASSTDQAIATLEKSAAQIEADLRQLVLLQTDKKQGGLRAVLPKNGPLGKKIVMHWNGPIEPAVKRIARAIRYQHRVLGTAPAAPITVKINVVKEKAYNVLDSIGWQAANKAQLLVDPLKKSITIAYLPRFGSADSALSHTASAAK
jgi:defect-in-organelle-trafficking protein DotD